MRASFRPVPVLLLPVVALAVVAPSAGAVTPSAGAPSAVITTKAVRCWSPNGATYVTQRRRISCATARSALRRIDRAVAASDYRLGLPICKGDRARTIAGWRLTAFPAGRSTPGTKYTRGRRSFVTQGGGEC